MVISVNVVRLSGIILFLAILPVHFAPKLQTTVESIWLATLFTLECRC
jgi:hypothetical protein